MTTEQSTCPRNLWDTPHGKTLRAQGWRLRKIPPKWDAENALIERETERGQMPKTKLIAIRICEPCLAGEGKECHTPECALFLHKVDLPIHPEIYKTLPEDFDITRKEERTKGLLAAVQLAYRKHHLSDPDIGWDELGDRLCDALCNEMGDEGFQQWLAIAAAEKEGA